VDIVDDTADRQIELQTLAAWREQDQEVTVTLLHDNVDGRIVAVTERSIILEDTEGEDVLCPWHAVIKIRRAKRPDWRERALQGAPEE
jgi:hypothetical protein